MTTSVLARLLSLCRQNKRKIPLFLWFGWHIMIISTLCLFDLNGLQDISLGAAVSRVTGDVTTHRIDVRIAIIIGYPATTRRHVGPAVVFIRATVPVVEVLTARALCAIRGASPCIIPQDILRSAGGGS
jgi:hypothetical protein